MRKVAVVLVQFSDSADCSSVVNALIEHISDWTEIEDAQFSLLIKGIEMLNRSRSYYSKYVLVEQIKIDKAFVSKTIDGYLKEMKRLDEIEQKRKEEARLKKEERDRKKAAKAVLAKDAMVRELKQKIEELEKQKG
jgi:hypothetical protein